MSNPQRTRRFGLRLFRKTVDRGGRHRARPRLELMEDRTLLATFNVTTFSDVVNASDGVTSLREAVNAANANSEDDVINLQDGPYSLSLGRLDITKGTVTVNGAGVNTALVGNGQAGVLYVGTNATLSLTRAIVKGGFSTFGGAGLYNEGVATLDSVTVRDNLSRGTSGTAFASGGNVFGGGINNTWTGTLTLRNSNVTANQAVGGAGFNGTSVLNGYFAPTRGGDAWGGGVMNGGQFTLVNSVIYNNQATGGAGGTASRNLIQYGLTDLQADGGDAYGGGLVNYATTIPGMRPGSVAMDELSMVGQNTAQGGFAGGTGTGGGIYLDSGTANLKGLLIANLAQGAAGAAGFSTAQDVLAVNTPGTNGKEGGPGTGGGVYLRSGVLKLSGASFDGNQAIGGAGGNGGEGTRGAWGTADSVNVNASDGGSGGNGGWGGFAGGGALYIQGGDVTAQGGSWTGNTAQGGRGGNGGQGGTGGVGKDGSLVYAGDFRDRIHVDQGGRGGWGGNGGTGGGGGYTTGGALAMEDGRASLTSVTISTNTASAGDGGWGGHGGEGGSGGAGRAEYDYEYGQDWQQRTYRAFGGGDGGRGGDGGNGGVGADAGGGGLAIGGGSLDVSQSTLDHNVATGGNGGFSADGGFPGAGGPTGNPYADTWPAGTRIVLARMSGLGGRGGNGGNGGNGGAGGAGLGGAAYLIQAVAGRSTSLAFIYSTLAANRANGGTGRGGSGTYLGGSGGRSWGNPYADNINQEINGYGGDGGNGGDGGAAGRAEGGAVFAQATGLELVGVTVAENALSGGGAGKGSQFYGAGGDPGQVLRMAPVGTRGRDGVKGRDGAAAILKGAGISGPAGLTSSIVASNTPTSSGDLAGAYGGVNHNLIGYIGTATGLSSATNQIGTSSSSPLNPDLEPLGDYGGPTFTMRPRATSKAIDKGFLANAQIDQRGLPRDPARVDVGAVERQSTASLGVTAPTSVVAGAGASVTVTAYMANGARNPDGAELLSVAATDPLWSGPGKQITLANGTATILAGLKTAGPQTVTVTRSSPTPVWQVATTIQVTPAPFDHLAFGQQPTNALAGSPITPAVTVRAVDPYGNLVASTTGTVQLAFDYNGTGASLLNSSASLVNGIATFPALTVNLAGGRYTLKASGVGNTRPISADFGVSPAITRRASGPNTINQGAPYTLNLEATGGSIASWNINWGDGSTSTVAGTDTTATHTYYVAANLGITVSATETNGTVRSVVYNRRDYIVDFQGPTAKTGWSYLWKQERPIGNNANYAPLTWGGFYGGSYSVDPSSFPAAGPGSYMILGRDWGHPGSASSQNGTFDRAVIASFTVPTAGTYQIVDGVLNRYNGGAGGTIGLLTYKGNALLGQVTGVAGAVSWNTSAVAMAAGDTFFAMVVPDGGDGYDTFGWDFSVVQTDRVPVSVAPVSRSATGPVSTVQGQPYTLNLAASGGSLASWRIDWGDGVIDMLAATTTTATHTFSTPTRGVAVTAIDTDETARPADTFVQNYTTSFSSPTPSTGWSYLWNSGGAIGNPANYTAMVANPAGTRYQASASSFPTAGAGSVLMASNGGHPGSPSPYSSSGSDIGAIAAYAVPSSGMYRLGNGTLTRSNGALGGSIGLATYAGATPLASFPNVTGTIAWSTQPVSLSAGSKFYAAVLPEGSDSYDSFAWNFDVIRVGDIPVTVANAPPSIAPAPSQTYNPGSPATFAIGSFSDGPFDGPWSVSIDWGDGSALTTLSMDSPGAIPDQSHTYAGFGSYAVAVSVADALGASATANVTARSLTGVSIAKAADQGEPASGDVRFAVTFERPVTGFTKAGVVIGGTALPTSATVSGSGATYTVTVSGMSQRGTVQASISAGAATDANGFPTLATSGASSVAFNRAPTSLSLSGGTIPESARAGTLVGTFSSTDPDLLDSAIYSLDSNPGSQFGLVGNQLFVTSLSKLDYETAPQLSITVSVKDGGGLTLSKVFTISLLDANEATAFTVQNGQAQRSMVRTLTMDFDGGPGLATLLSPGRVTLTRVGLDGRTENVSLANALTLAGNRLTFDFGTAGLQDGRYTLAVDADGDGVAETVRRFHRLFGDTDGDGDVDASDYKVFLAAYKKSSVYGTYWFLDADSDGAIAEADFTAFQHRYGKKI